MAKLERIKQIMEMSGVDTLVVVSIPLTSDLMKVSRDFFPPYFKGWCAATTHQIPELYGIQEMELADAYEALDTVWFSRASFAIVDCPLEMVQRFCLALEARTNTKPDSENELFVFKITLEKGKVAKRTIVTSVQSVFPELPPPHRTNAQASI
jgi:hypothetical protein